jgi:hypothetical protein
MELSIAATQDMLSALAEHAAMQSGGAPPPGAAQRRTAFKVLAYMFATAVQVADKTSNPTLTAASGGKSASGSTKRGAAGKKGGKKGGNKSAAAVATQELIDDDALVDPEEANAENDEDGSSGFDWASLRSSCINLLTEILSADFGKLWSLGVPEEAFVSTFTKTGTRLLSSPYCMKDKEAKRAVEELLAFACAKFPSVVTATVAALADAITKFEHASDCAASIGELWAGDADVISSLKNSQESSSVQHSRYFAPHVAADLLREVGVSNSSDSKDSAGLRRASSFIINVSERSPHLVLTNISVLLPHMERDSHQLRSALVSTLGNIVARSFSSAALATARTKEEVDNMTRTRDVLLDVLVDRGHDINAVVRAAALKAWVTLASCAAIPLARLAAVTALAVGRLRDKGAVVRKNAAQLLRALLENNPFGPKIVPELFERNVKAADDWLKVHANAIWVRISDKSGGGARETEPNPESKKDEGSVAKSVAKRGGSKNNNIDDNDAEEGDEKAAPEKKNPTDEDLIADAASQPASTENLVVTPEVAAYVRAREMYGSAAKFSTQVASAVPTMATELLSSKTSSDVMEAIRFLSRARAFGVPGAEAGLARMLVLVWAEGNVKEEVVATFDKLYILNEALEDEDVEALAIAGGATEDGGEAIKPSTTDETELPSASGLTASTATTSKSSSTRGGGGGAKKTKAKAAKAANDDEDDDNDDDAPKKPRKARAAASKKLSAQEIDDDDNDDENKGNDDDEDAEVEDEDDDDDDEGNGKKKRGKGASKPRAPRKKAAAAPAAAAAVLRKATVTISASQRAALDPAVIGQNLVGLLSGAPLAVRTSLEEVLRLCALRGLIPQGVVSCLWDTVAYGVATLARTRISVANTLAQQQRAAAETASSSTSSSSSSEVASPPPPSQTQAAAQIRSQASQIEIILQRSRAAMSVLTMVAAADPTTIDSLAGLARMRAVLTPQRITGFPSGSGLLRAAHAALCVGPNGVSKEVAAAAVDHVLSQGDYRLAKHACAALLRFRGNSLLSVGTSSKAIMAAAAAEEASAAAALAAAAAGSKKGSTSAAAVQKAKELEAEKASAAKARSENVESIILSLCDLIGGEWDGGGDLHNVHYYAAAQQALDAIFCLASNPAAICSDILREMAARALILNPRDKSANEAASASTPSFEFIFSSSVSRSRLSRFFFVLGHVPLKTLVHVEALSTRAKLLRIKASEKADHTNSAPPVNSAVVAGMGGGGKKGGEKGKAAAAAAAGPKDDIEAQLGSAAAEDEKEAELVTSIAEKELLSTQSLCGLFAPLLEHITKALLQPQDADAITPENETLAQSALLSLCKLSAVSSDFCEKQLPLLFTILSRAHNPRIRALTVIALGDLAFRFPNMVEPYTSHLYARLRDADTRVRKNTLMVLTHLILNDMVKVKGQVGEIAVCLSDPDQRISDLTRIFFTELSKRSSNPIYNILPDTLSCLSRLASGEVQNQEFAAAIVADAGGVNTGPSPVALRQLDRETFRDIVRFLLSFIGKDKQSDSLAEKLLHRFESTSAGGGEGGGGEKQESSPQQQAQKPTADSALAGSPYVAALWRDLAFCLSQLPLSEKSIRRMAESVRTYKTALVLPDVWESFVLMLNKAKKMVSVSSSAAASAAAKDAAEGGSAPTTTSSGGISGASKVEMRQLVEEWEKALLEARSGAAEDDSALMNAKVVAKRARRIAEKEGVDSDKIASQALVAAKDAAAAVAAAAAPTKSKTSAKAAAAATAKVNAGLSTKESVAAAPPPPPPSSRPARKGAARKGIVIEDDDDDDDEEEDEVVKPTASKSRGGSRATTPNAGGGRKK